jgi:hypothetical protein
VDRGTALQASRRRFQKVIRHARIGTRESIENALKWQFCIFATGFAAGDQVLIFRGLLGGDIDGSSDWEALV